ncbi:MAG: hypothetical protein KJO07_15355, partial [Deltaproteobacteria bacterium]|nr:hypothetical protein [Deltaproteobacteria bacterium]
DGSYQKLAYIYNTDVLTVTSPALLFQNNGYEFPRPPFKVKVQVNGSDLDFDVIGLHLKAGFGNEDEMRRAAALELLEGTVRSGIEGSGDDDVIVLGDFNETLDQGADILAPFLDASADYTFETALLAAAEDYTFIPSRNLIDHIVTSASLDDELAAAETVIPDLLDEVQGYTSEVSDHLPVILSFPAP